MKNAAAIRITVHACLLFAAAALIPPLMLESYLGYYITAALILFASMLGLNIKLAPLRVLVSLIPFAGLLLISKIPSALIIGAIACAYAAVSIISARVIYESWRYTGEFKVILGIYALLTIVFLFVVYVYGGEKPANLSNINFIEPTPAAKSAFWVFFSVSVLLAFLAMRCLRAGNIKSARWQVGNIGYFALPLALSIAAGIGLSSVARNIDFKSPIERLANSISACSTGEVNLPITTSVPREQAPVPVIASAVPEFEYSDYEAAETSAPINETSKKTVRSISLWVIAAIGGAAAAVLAVFLIIKGGRAKNLKLIEDDAEKGADEESVFGSLFRRKGLSKKGYGNSEKVRELYRRYISFLRMHGVSTDISTTSEELSERSKKILLDEQPDELLRSLYRRARYTGEELTDEDVRLAEQAFDRIIEKTNIKEETTEVL